MASFEQKSILILLSYVFIHQANFSSYDGGLKSFFTVTFLDIIWSWQQLIVTCYSNGGVKWLFSWARAGCSGGGWAWAAPSCACRRPRRRRAANANERLIQSSPSRAHCKQTLSSGIVVLGDNCWSCWSDFRQLVPRISSAWCAGIRNFNEKSLSELVSFKLANFHSRVLFVLFTDEWRSCLLQLAQCFNFPSWL